MVKTKWVSNGGLKVKKVHTYVPDEIKDSSALKKEEIVKLIDEGDQLTLLARVIIDIAEKIELDTPAYAEAKEIYANILDILSKEK